MKNYYLTLTDDFNEILKNNTPTKTLKLSCNQSKNNGNMYKIINYEKSQISHDNISTTGIFRSVILNKNGNLVCFSPPKSIQTDTFIKSYPEIDSNIIAQEFIEGTMINVFWDPSVGLTGGWEIATRNTIGATSKFFKSANSKTFRDMFLEAAQKNNLILECLNRNYCYSFVLQHPENRIVVPFLEPQLYLVAMYFVYRENYQVAVQPLEDIAPFFTNTTIKFPQVYEDKTYSELINKYASMNTDYNILGLVLINKVTGERAKIRNPVYEQVRQLRGNQPKLQFQYLCLRKEGKVKDFLKFYPENKTDFTNFRDQVHLFTDTLFTNYISCYIKKEKPLKEFPEQFRTHIFKIHKIYIEDLKEKKLYVNNTVVINYVNNILPAKLMYSLNFHMRKRNQLFKKVEQNESE
jgi:hypothetical protein